MLNLRKRIFLRNSLLAHSASVPHFQSELVFFLSSFHCVHTLKRGFKTYIKNTLTKNLYLHFHAQFTSTLKTERKSAKKRVPVSLRRQRDYSLSRLGRDNLPINFFPPFTDQRKVIGYNVWARLVIGQLLFPGAPLNTY